MNRKHMATLEILGGALLLFLATTVFPELYSAMLSGICIGFGSAALVFGIVNLIRSFTVSDEKHNARVKEIMTEQKDERNHLILSKTSNMTSKILTVVVTIAIVVLSFLGVDKLIIIGLSTLLILKAVLFISFSNYYSNRL